MKTVLFVAYHFPPTAGPASQRNRLLVKYLPSAGWRPLVLTSTEAPGEPRDAELLDAAGEGDVVRTPPSVLPAWTYRVGVVHRALNRIAVPDVQLLWWPLVSQAAANIMSRCRVDALYTTAGPFSVALMGDWLKQKYSLPWIVDFRDGWTLGAGFRPPTPFHAWLNRRLEQRVSERCDAFVANTETLLERQCQRFPLLRGKSVCIPNGFDPVGGLPRLGETRSEGPWRLLYAGTWYRKLYSDDLFRRLSDFQRQRPERLFALHYAGPHGAVFKELAARYGLLNNFVNHGHVPHAQMRKLLIQSDLLLATLPPDDRARSWVPAKIYEYLAVGQPILFFGPHGDAARLLNRFGCAILRPNEDTAEDGFRCFEDLWSRRGQPVAPRTDLDRYGYPMLARALADVLNRAVAE